VTLDYAEAKRWYEKAVAAGNSQAMTNIGDFYRNGYGVTQDLAEAKRPLPLATVRRFFGTPARWASKASSPSGAIGRIDRVVRPTGSRLRTRTRQQLTG
jgi:TPR repeat protein